MTNEIDLLIIWRVLDGKASEGEIRELKGWMEEKESNREYFRQWKKIWNMTNGPTLSVTRKQREKERFLKSIHQSYVGKVRKRRIIHYWPVAASVVLLVGVFVGFALNEWSQMKADQGIAQTERINLNIAETDLLKTYHVLLYKKISEENNLFRDFTIQYLIQATFYEVCQLLLKHLEIKKKKLPHKEDIFKQFLKLVETHHYKERDISFYAEKLCLTPKYLSSIIRDVSGELAGNWIDNYVIIEAKALLISSNLTIQEICYKLNFSTPSSFTRFFKRITGMSPRKFRTLKVFPNLIE